MQHILASSTTGLHISHCVILQYKTSFIRKFKENKSIFVKSIYIYQFTHVVIE
ncbi:unnamed protein product [Cylicocyclus nassatus]|uniref:Uncharacterized protein n=1 Tax=Cylicocyclus nassatus TaxID=53992 RepID=A0AA36ME68_CYLNA|nr:unnamed protein product [Cylicocyclus nassatus]